MAGRHTAPLERAHLHHLLRREGFSTRPLDFGSEGDSRQSAVRRDSAVSPNVFEGQTSEVVLVEVRADAFFPLTMGWGVVGDGWGEGERGGRKGDVLRLSENVGKQEEGESTRGSESYLAEFALLFTVYEVSVRWMGSGNEVRCHFVFHGRVAGAHSLHGIERHALPCMEWFTAVAVARAAPTCTRRRCIGPCDDGF